MQCVVCYPAYGTVNKGSTPRGTKVVTIKLSQISDARPAKEAGLMYVPVPLKQITYITNTNVHTVMCKAVGIERLGPKYPLLLGKKRGYYFTSKLLPKLFYSSLSPFS